VRARGPNRKFRFTVILNISAGRLMKRTFTLIFISSALVAVVFTGGCSRRAGEVGMRASAVRRRRK